jgi:hypothetical protein
METFLDVIILCGIIAICIISINILKKLKIINDNIVSSSTNVIISSSCFFLLWIVNEIYYVWFFSIILIVFISIVQQIYSAGEMRHATLTSSTGYATSPALQQSFYTLIAMPVIILLDNSNVAHVKAMAFLPTVVIDFFRLITKQNDDLILFATDDEPISIKRLILFMLTIFLVFFGSCLLLTSFAHIKLLIISLIVAILVTLVKLSSWHNIENVFIPIGISFILQKLFILNIPTLILHVCILITLITVAFLNRDKVRLSEQGLIASLISGMTIWFVGGWMWVLPILVFFVIHPIIIRLDEELQVAYGAMSILSISSNAFIWLICKLFIMKMVDVYYCFILGCIAHFAMILCYRLQDKYQKPISLASILQMALLAYIILIPIYFYSNKFSIVSLYLGLIAGGINILGIIIFSILKNLYDHKYGRWMVQFTTSTLYGVSGLVPLLVIS